MDSGVLKRHQSIIIFILFAFFIPLPCLTIMRFIPGMQTGTGYFILFGISAISPTLAGMLTVIFCKKEETLLMFLKRCFLSKYNKKLCVLAISVPVIEIVVMQIFCLATGTPIIPISKLSLGQFLIVAYSLIAEEIGWRGFLQNRLDKFLRPYLISIVTGIIWALWHYHFYIVGTISVPVFWFLIGCIADSVIYYWVTRKANGNIIPVSLLHFSYNLASNLFIVADSAAYAYFVIGSIIVAVCIALWVRKDKHIA